MRKLLNIIGLSAVVLLASCDMDKIPQGALDSKEAFKDVASVEYLGNGVMSCLRANYGISNTLLPDIQMDYVNAASGYSNTYGEVYKWSFQQNDYDITAAWDNCYFTISQCNFILDGIKANFDDADRDLSADELDRLDVVRARLYLARAMSYSMLAERFCADYDEATATKQYSGVPLVLNFAPDAKPSRATLFEVYDRILKDLELAKSGLATVKGAADAIYLNRDCVTAMQAHVYLQMDMHQKALDAANSLIANPAYSLATSLEEFDDVWTYDRGKEIIFKFAASKTELPASYATVCFYDQLGGSYDKEGQHYWAPDYLPTQDLIDTFDAEDYRAKSWFFTQPWDNGMNFCWCGGSIIMTGYTMISKFTGNPDLRTSEGWNYANTWKVFRLAEMYLIAAEAALQVPGEEAKALTLLKTLREHRGLAELPVVTMAEVKEERYKELMLEGFRMTDLKRWGDGVQRGISQYGTFGKMNIEMTGVDPQKDDYLSILPARDLNMPATDFHFLWPVPYNEIFANQNLKNQQNPGWEK